MSLPLVVNGVTYNYPEVDDVDWGPDATDWASAVTTGMLQKAGGLFQILAEVDFGTAFGVKSLYLKSRTANPASAGQIRFARADVLNWRNQANDGDLSLSVDSSNILNFNGSPLQGGISVSDTATIDLTFTSNTLSADIKALSIDNSLISNSAAIAYSKLNLSGSIVNADVDAAAAIVYSKLSLTDSIVNADINSAAAIAYSKLALSGSIVNADIAAGAAIAFSKLATLSSGNILVGSAGNVATSLAMTGDVTISNAGVTAIGANKVLNSMLAQMAQSTIKGRAASSGTGDPVDLSATQATAILNNFVGDSGSGGTKGLVPAPAAGDSAAGKFLKADGSWVAPTGAGDVVGPASATDSGFAKFDGTTGKLLKDSPATISNSDVASNAAIAFSKLAALTSANLLVGSAGNVATSVAITGDISFSNAGVTAYAGTVPVNKGGTGQTSYTNGQILIGNTTGNTLAKATLTQGANITITNGAGSITIAASSTAIPAWTYASQSSTLNPAVIGTYYVLSGASFTITLPTAASIAGQGFVFQHGGTSLSQVYTFNTTSAQTIGGIASGSYALYTNGEALLLVSDGANWQIQSHKATTAWTAYTPTFSAGLGTPTSISYYWSRNAASMKVRGTHVNGSTAPSLFSMTIPSGASIDTTAISINNTTSNPGSLIGQWVDSGSTVSYTNMVSATGTSTTLVYFGGFSNGAAKLTPANGNNSGTGVTASIIFEIPISGWQP